MNRKSWISALILLAALGACGGKAAEPSEPAAPAAGSEQAAPPVVEEPAPEPAPEAAPAPAPEPAVETKLPVASAVVVHKVQDFDAWKKGFDENQAARQGAGIVAHHLSRGVDDPSLVAIYVIGTDAEKLAAFFKNPELKKVMKAAGVKGKPDIHLLSAVENKTATDPKLPAVIVMHEVKDFDAWKPVFDEDAANRSAGGVLGDTVSRDVDKPNLVVIYLQASSIEALKGFGASKELKAKMKAGGVKGKPSMQFVQGVEWVQYK